MTDVRIRGIYATALTRLLSDADFDVVQASPPIRRRFDEDFATAEHDVELDMTSDRQGVEISGNADAVHDALREVEDLALDTFTWPDRAARGAIFNAVVERDVGGGAVLALADDHEGYLPYDNAEEYVEEGDRLRVQVYEPAPFWESGRAVVGTQVRAMGGIATLVRGVDSLVAGTPDGTAEHELVRTTEMLPTAVPDGWAVKWEYAAEDASMDALNDALSAAVRRSNQLEEAIADAPSVEECAPYRVAAPQHTVWAWFGRESRFALDDVRREVTDTMAGHHRIKAGSRSASTAVDFAERLCEYTDAFPFGAVTEQFGPTEGDLVAIDHGKPDGRLITIGRGEVTNRDVEKGRITVRREMSPGGTYDALGVEREAGDVAITRFTEGKWWYPTIYQSEDGGVKGTYINISTPVELFPDGVRYIDLHVDVVKHADGSAETVDLDELEECVDAGHVSEPLAEKARDVAERLERVVSED